MGNALIWIECTKLVHTIGAQDRSWPEGGEGEATDRTELGGKTEFVSWRLFCITFINVSGGYPDVQKTNA